jgi:hypothetical protein
MWKTAENDKILFSKRSGSFLPGVGKIDEPDTWCGGYLTSTPPCAMPTPTPEKNTAWLIHSQNLSNLVCENAPAAVVSD